MLNIATTTGSTESYNTNQIWYDIDDNCQQTYTIDGLIQNIVDKADIMKCIKIKNIAIILLSAVNDRFKQDAIHESKRGKLESGHNNYAIKLSEFYTILDLAVSNKVDTLMSAKRLEINSKKSNLRKKKSAFGNKKKQRTKTKPKKQRTKTKHKPKKQRTRTKSKPKK